MDLLQQGQKLGIYFQKNEMLVEMLCTISKVFDDRINIELPPYFMRYIEYLDVGKRLTVKVFSKLGTIDFNGIIISSPMEEEFSVELDYNAMKLTPREKIPSIKPDKDILPCAVQTSCYTLSRICHAREHLEYPDCLYDMIPHCRTHSTPFSFQDII